MPFAINNIQRYQHVRFSPGKRAWEPPVANRVRAPAGSARTGASNAVPYLNGKSARGRLRVRAEWRPPWWPRRQLQRILLSGDPRGGRSPRVSHLHHRARAAAAAARPGAARSAPPPHQDRGREAPVSSIQQDQILTRFLPGLGITGIRRGQLFVSKSPSDSRQSVWDSWWEGDSAGPQVPWVCRAIDVQLLIPRVSGFIPN